MRLGPYLSYCNGAIEYPTVAFKAGTQRYAFTYYPNPSVGFIGYPNVGKSSIINTLAGKKVCNVAPIPGETKVWQYIALMKHFLQKLSHKSGRLLKGGEPDIETVSKMIINDFQRGKLPYFVPPPILPTSDVGSITSVISMEEQKLEEIEHTTEFSQKHVDALS
ncbi:hypothetical protein MXB_5476 [Myxobolus squamalis]|nr:hypothetical protein MXB_5476 [Myxobolus squamalis]